MSRYHSLKISTIDRLTDAAIKITFEVPDNLRETFLFKSGQYLSLKANIDGNDIRRDYSICSSVNSGYLSIGVKAVKNGTFSTYANQKLCVGNTIEVMPPQGRFVFEHHPDKTRTIAAFAAGSGITPILSIGKTLLEEEPFSNFILVYGNKSAKDTMFLDELIKLKDTYGNRFHLHQIYSQQREDKALFGRIEKSTVNLIVKNKYQGVNIESFYLCGPEAMINTVKDVLIENGVRNQQIKFELFTASAPVENVIKEASSEETTIKVIVDEEETEFVMQKSQTILEAALKKDIDAPYSCQGGICSSCVGRITEGTATMKQNNILTDSEVAEGLVLTCQACPTSDYIVVDYDDV
jgi:ring-1,2-phenylacetyl-CoA epoxidase subunit PaaE